MKIKYLTQFMNKFAACPRCGQHLIMKDEIKRTNFICKENMLIRECLDCNTTIIYIKD